MYFMDTNSYNSRYYSSVIICLYIGLVTVVYEHSGIFFALILLLVHHLIYNVITCKIWATYVSMIKPSSYSCAFNYRMKPFPFTFASTVKV